MGKPHNQEFLLKSATYLSVATAFLILIAKSYGLAKTDSASILASLVDSTLDISSSLINMFALRFALVPPDNEHRFGHDKIQDLAVFGQGAFFIASSIFVLISAGMNFHAKVEVVNPEIGISVMIFSVIMTAILVSYQTYVLSKTTSNILKADKLHYVTDLLSNLTVIISIYFSKSYWYIDSIFAALIAVYLFYGAAHLLSDSLKNLLDHELSDEEKSKIHAVLKKYIDEKKILDAHDIKTRKAGNKHFIQFHMEMDAKISLGDAHKVTEALEQELIELFNETEVIIHQDPSGFSEPIEFKDKIHD